MCNQHKSFGQQKHLSTSLQLYIYIPSSYRTQCSLFCLNILSGDCKYSGIQFTQLICQKSRSRFTPTNAFLSGFFCWKFVSFGNNKPIEWRKNALSVISSHLWKVLKKTPVSYAIMALLTHTFKYFKRPEPLNLANSYSRQHYTHTFPIKADKFELQFCQFGDLEVRSDYTCYRYQTLMYLNDNSTCHPRGKKHC